MKATHTAVVSLPEWIIEAFAKCESGSLYLKDGTCIGMEMFKKNGYTVLIHKSDDRGYEWHDGYWYWKSDWLTDIKPIEEKKEEGWSPQRILEEMSRRGINVFADPSEDSIPPPPSPESVDWSKVPRGTIVEVRDAKTHNWVARYFCRKYAEYICASDFSDLKEQHIWFFSRLPKTTGEEAKKSHGES